MELGKYRQTVIASVKKSAAYKASVVVGLVNSVVMLVLYYAIWSSIASSGSLKGGLTQVMSYLVIGQAVARATGLRTENFLGKRVRKGSITNELKRPMSIRRYVYFHEVGSKLLEAAVMSLPILALGMFFFGVRIPGVQQLMLFGTSLFLAFNLVFAASFITSVLAFWTKVEWSLRMMRNLLTNLFSGRMFPLYLVPAAISPVFEVLPFRGMVDTPVQIFMGRATGREALMLLGHQLIWILVLLGVGELVWSKAREQLTVQGG